MPLAKPALIKRAKKVKLVAMDVDGVLTNGDIIVLQSGEEIKFWSSKDRFALALMRSEKVPLTFAWITGRSSESVRASAEDLGIHHVVQKCGRKKEALEVILAAHKLKFDEAAFVGDDLLDLPPMLASGFSACPADAVADVQKRAHYISSHEGGRGVVRDVLEFILRAQNRWDALVSSFLR